MKTAWVTVEGGLLRRAGGRLIVARGAEELASLVAAELEQVCVVGNVTISAGALDLLAEHRIDLALLSGRGRLRARLSTTGAGNAPLRVGQYRLLEQAARASTFARAVVAGKLLNQRVLLLRAARQRKPADHDAAAVERLQDAARALAAQRVRLQATQADVEAVRGHEGAGAARYFGAFDDLVGHPSFRFTGRSRRPPLDPLNALLSFGYTLLTTRMLAALDVVGLDPLPGLLHAPEGSRPSVALDLMEPFRPLVVDALVVGAVRHGVIRPEHFDTPGPGEPVVLTDDGRRIFVGLFAARIERDFVDVRTGRRRRLQDLLVEEARAFARFVLHDEPFIPQAMR